MNPSYRRMIAWTLAMFTSSLAGSHAAIYEITRYTIDGGGIVQSAGGQFELSGTIGQLDAGVMSGGSFELTGGFWIPLGPGDCNEDGVVGLFDHAAFRACLTGPSAPIGDGCRCFDLDLNGRIDLADVAAMQLQFGGS